jgi:hypothetical protein
METSRYLPFPTVNMEATPPKCQKASTRLHGVTSQRRVTFIFPSVRNSNLTAIPRSQKHSLGLYPKPYESSPHPPIPFRYDPVLAYLPYFEKIE